MIRRLLSTDVMSGVFILALGLVAVLAIGNAEIGVINDMGTGYLPRVIAFLMIGGGVVLCILGLLREPESVPPLFLKPLLMVSLAVAAFALTADRLGMVIAVASAIMIASLASPESRLRETLPLAAGFALGAVLLFIFGLKMPIPIWPR